MKDLKLVLIGGGSSYTPELADGLIKKRVALPVSELVLVDIEAGKMKAEINGALLRRMFRKAELPIQVSVTLERREALQGADFVVTQFRVGGLAARAKDERIPLHYDLIGQETTGPGGFTKALRTIPVILDICRDMEEICPEAWLINFTNPSGIVTEAVLKHSHVKCIGLCNVPLNMEQAIIKHLAVDGSRVHMRFIGLNHLSFITSVHLDSRDVTAEILASAVVQEEIFKNIQGIAGPGDFLQTLGLIPSPYLRYFYFEKQMLAEEVDNVASGIGTRAEEVMEIERTLFERYQDENLTEKPAELEKRGGALYSEAALALMDGLWNNRSERQVVNTLNLGAIQGLPEDAVIETDCLIDAQGAHPLAYGPLPIKVRGLVQQVKAYEQLTVEAAVSGDRAKALLALMNNPLVHDVPAAKNVLAELLMAHKDHLPKFWAKEGTP